ncbi:MAG: FtsX-like permease family protein [Chthoniobacterales bacterium]
MFVSQRQRELALRIALGASRGSIVRLVIGQTMLNAGIGTLLGLNGAWLLNDWFAVFFSKSHRLIRAHS